jgi:O-succinylbenzoate synthase
MKLSAAFCKHTLNFSFDAGTSRGVLRKKDSYFLHLFDADHPETVGIGEAGPLFGLSPEFGDAAEQKMGEVVKAINAGEPLPSLENYSSILFALETARYDLIQGGKRILFPSKFTSGEEAISINGLIWMGQKEFMKEQIIRKIEAGFQTIKMKIGAIDFETEMELLRFIRREFSERDLTLRVDANGAFSPDEALLKLEELSTLRIHSIEQPIKAGQEEQLAKLCEETPLPIALDEELIPNFHRKEELLGAIKPQFIILKPTLMGGLQGSRDWIQTAERLGIDWWITSALESNVGLNAIAQFTAELGNPLPQGLGTGTLYTNNIPSPLFIEKGKLAYDPTGEWDLHSIQSIGERRY